MKYNLSSKNSVLVIDIGAGSLKLLEVDRGRGKPILKKLFIEDFPPEIQEKPFLEKDFLIKRLKDIIRKNEIKTKKTILILPDEITDLVLLTLPKQTEEELKTSTKWEFKDYISYPVEEAHYKYRITREFTDKGVPKINVVVVSTPKKEIDKYCEILDELELEPITFTVGLTSYGPIIHNSGLIKEDENFIVVDIGAKTTVLGVFIEDNLYFYRKADFGGRDITLSLMNENTDFQKAEELKRQTGISIADENMEGFDSLKVESAKRNFESAKGVLGKLIAETQRCISFYKETLRGGEVNKLFIFGGGSKLKGLKAFLSSTLGIDIFSPNPFTEVQTENIDREKLQESSAFLTRAWGGFLKTKRFTNLLPEEIMYRQKTKIKHTLIRTGICVLTAILALIYTGVFINGNSLTKELSSAKKMYAGLGPKMDKINEIRKAKEVLQKQMDLCIELLSKEPFWEDILKEIGRLIPDNIILTELNIKKGSNGKEDFRETYKDTGPEEGITLLLEGKVYPGKDTLERSLTVFLNLISESEFFADTKLDITKENKEGDKIVLDFTIQSKVNPLNIGTKK